MKALLVVVMLLGLCFSYESSFAQARYDGDYYWGDESIPASKGIPGELIILIIIIGAVFFIRLHLQDRPLRAKLKEIKEQKISGDAETQFELGVMCNKGQVVPKNRREADKLFLKAAEQGHAGAQHNLGWSHRFGHGSQLRDQVQSYAWYNIAAANGGENAKDAKIQMAAEMTKEQIALAQKLSEEMVEANPKLIN